MKPTDLRLAALVLALLVGACEPQLIAGTWSCPAPDTAATDDAGAPLPPVDTPWSTGFETGFCDFTRTGGFCFGSPDATYQIVNAPVHGGRRAAAFSITSDTSKDGAQTRCVRQGALPLDATYGAWFYLPLLTSNNKENWNLLHFQGGAPDAWHDLWDVSLGNAADGSLFLYVYDAIRGTLRVPVPSPPVPIGRWFQIEFRLLRAKDATGRVALYHDGALLIELEGLITDDSDFGQWYVGNLAEAIGTQEYTLYVDDVTIRAAP